jgi:Cytochrome P460
MKMPAAAFLCVSGTLACGLWLWAQPGDAVVPYPDGYRSWMHVKSTVVGPESPAFASNGGIHHFYANEKAVEGYRGSRFPDGSVLIDDLLEAKQENGVTSAGPRRRVAVMVKNAELYHETGGWGFEIFKSDGQIAGLMPQDRAACFACHKNGRDSVFSELQK